MSYRYSSLIKETPQTSAIPGKQMVKNNAGGFVFKIDKWQRLMRFLILGAESGTYYVNQKAFALENIDRVLECINEDSRKVLTTLLDVSLNGRALKQDATIFLLALVSSQNKGTKDVELNELIKSAVLKVCRTPTMLFMYLKFVRDLRGMGPSVRKSIAKYYTETDFSRLDLSVIKYRNREGYTHRDALRLSHPKAKDEKRQQLFAYLVGKANAPEGTMCELFEKLKTIDLNTKKGVSELIGLITKHNIPRELLPTAALNNADVWRAMLPGMPIMALVRNLGKMSSLNIFDSNLRDETIMVVNKLGNKEVIEKSRIHPMQLYIASKVYSAGRGVKGSLSWRPNAKIRSALDTAMTLAFKNIKPTGKRFLIGADISGSMTCSVLGTDFVSAYEASACLVTTLVRTEENVDAVAFGSPSKGGYRSWNEPRNYGFSIGNNGVSVMPVNKKESVDSLVGRMQSNYHMGSGTDCSLPISYALNKKIPVDVFVITTDNETWAGKEHVCQILDKYRKTMGINAKLFVMATSSSDFTIADPNDPGMLDCAGFDASVFSLLSEFALQE